MMTGGRTNAYTIGPLINKPATRNANSITRWRAVQSPPVRALSNMSTPIAKQTKANGISVRTSVASRGLNKLNPKAESAASAGKSPKAFFAVAKIRKARAMTAKNDGNRQAKSHERVIS